MKETKKIFFVVLVLSLFAFAGWSCGKKAPAPTVEPEGAVQPERAAQPEGVEDLAAILQIARGITNYSYDQIIKTDSETVSTAVYIKDKKVRQDMTVAGQNTSTYIDLATDVLYMYTPATKQAIRMSTAQKDKSKSLGEEIAKIDPSAKIIGRETINGEDCVIAQMVIDNTTEKFWISKRYGLPMKIETRSPEGVTTLTEIRNLKVGGVTDEDVTLPPDAVIVGMPGFGQ